MSRRNRPHRHEHQRNDRIEKTCQHSAMKHPKQNKRAPPTHSSALAVPSYHRILVKHGLIEKTLSIPDAYKVFLKVGADPEATETPSQDRIRRQNETRSRFVSGHSDGSAISELQSPAWSCLAEPSLWPDTKRERVSFCRRILSCDGVSVASGSAPTFKNTLYASGMDRVFSIRPCLTKMR